MHDDDNLHIRGVDQTDEHHLRRLAQALIELAGYQLAAEAQPEPGDEDQTPPAGEAA